MLKKEIKFTCKVHLIVISTPEPVANEAENINRLMEAGLGLFHLRKPESDLVSVAQLLSEIDPKYYDRIALHQHHGLATEFGLKRLHFTEKHREKASLKALQEIRQKGLITSTSIHDFSLLSSLNHFDYTFFSPVFDSISKQGYSSSLESGFRLEKPVGSPKVFALGGVELKNLSQVKTMKFDGAAVLGAIWNREEEVRIGILKGLMETCRNLNF